MEYYRRSDNYNYMTVTVGDLIFKTDGNQQVILPMAYDVYLPDSKSYKQNITSFGAGQTAILFPATS